MKTAMEVVTIMTVISNKTETEECFAPPWSRGDNHTHTKKIWHVS